MENDFLSASRRVIRREARDVTGTSDWNWSLIFDLCEGLESSKIKDQLTSKGKANSSAATEEDSSSFAGVVALKILLDQDESKIECV